MKLLRFLSVMTVLFLSFIICASLSFGQTKAKTEGVLLEIEDDDTIEELTYKIQHNGYNFMVDHNWVFDMSPEEKQKFFSRRHHNLLQSGGLQKGMGPLTRHLEKTQLPSGFDWRNHNGHSYIDQAVRNQGACGACYAFGASAAAEGTYNWANGLYDSSCIDFSESFIAWCLGTYGPYAAHFGGCEGADYTYSELEALTNEGITYESNFPYTTDDPGSCTHWQDPVVTFDGWYRVTCSDIDAIKTAIITYGVVDAAVLVDSAFQAYSSGVYENTNNCCYGDPCSYTTTDHVIALVGWNDAGDPENNGYWILRNSWGPDWGESGYMRIRYNSAAVSCAVCYMVYECDDTVMVAEALSPETGDCIMVSTPTTVSVGVLDECGTVVGGTLVAASFSNGDSDLTLYDDGNHNDGSPNDGVHANEWTPQNEQAPTIITYTASKAGYATATTDVSVSVTPYCVASGDPVCEWITNVTFAGINNSSGPSGYSDFTAGTLASVEPGASEVISVTIQADFDDYVSAFIDWNQDFDFKDPNERYDIVQLTNSNGPHLLTVNVPPDAALGETRMRVMLVWNSAPEPCGSFSYGEVEDYRVHVVEGKTICSFLGDHAFAGFSSVRDCDAYIFDGEQGEEVIIKLEPDPLGAYTGEYALSAYESPIDVSLFKKIRKFRMAETQRGALPLEMTLALPTTGQYRIKVGQSSFMREGGRFYFGDQFEGNYCLTLESSGDAWQTLEPTSSSGPTTVE